MCCDLRSSLHWHRLLTLRSVIASTAAASPSSGSIDSGPRRQGLEALRRHNGCERRHTRRGLLLLVGISVAHKVDKGLGRGQTAREVGEVERRLVLDTVVRERAAALESFSSEDELHALRDALEGASWFVLEFLLQLIDRVGRLHVERDSVTRERLDVNLHRKRGPARFAVNVQILDIELKPDTEFLYERPPNMDNVMFYCLDGGGRLNGANTLYQRQICRFDTTTGKVKASVSASSGGMRFMVFAGVSLKEPLTWHGPFVCADRGQLEEVFRQHQAGAFPPVRVP